MVEIARRPLLLAGLGLVLFGPGARAQSADAKQPVAALYDALRASMKLGKTATFPQHFDRIAQVIDGVFDLDTILRASVGPRWAAMDDGAKKTLAAVFRTFTIATYAANFDEDGGERFDVLPDTRASGADVIVASKLTPAKGDAVRIDYLMRQEGPSWRIVDVLLDGSISRVAVQRSDFRALLASGDPTPLIDSLKKKVVELSNGAMRP